MPSRWAAGPVTVPRVRVGRPPEAGVLELTPRAGRVVGAGSDGIDRPRRASVPVAGVFHPRGGNVGQTQRLGGGPEVLPTAGSRARRRRCDFSMPASPMASLKA